MRKEQRKRIIHLLRTPGDKRREAIKEWKLRCDDLGYCPEDMKRR